MWTMHNEQQYEVSRVERPTIHNGKQSYVVKWKGYKERTIESRQKLVEDIPKMIKQFDKKHNVVWHEDRFTWNDNQRK